MYDIALFYPLLNNKEVSCLKTYEHLVDENLVNNPTIFCDSSSIIVKDNISIFASFYMKQKFKNYIIVTDIEHAHLVDKATKTIVMHNNQDLPLIDNNTYYISYEQDIIKELKDIL